MCITEFSLEENETKIGSFSHQSFLNHFLNLSSLHP